MAPIHKKISQKEYESLDLSKFSPEVSERFRLIRKNNLHIGDSVKIEYLGEYTINGMTDKGFIILENLPGYFHPIALFKI